MRAILQRVSEAAVSIDGKVCGEIGKGLVVLWGTGPDDTMEDMDWLVKKILQLRIFKDEADKMNFDIHDAGGDILLVSQFTLYANCKKGNRPSFTRSALPQQAIPMYEAFIAKLRAAFNGKVETGEFGADMQVALVNDGPVTIALDTRDRDGFITKD